MRCGSPKRSPASTMPESCKRAKRLLTASHNARPTVATWSADGSSTIKSGRLRRSAWSALGQCRVRRGMIQLAWRFLLHQKNSALRALGNFSFHVNEMSPKIRKSPRNGKFSPAKIPLYLVHLMHSALSTAALTEARLNVEGLYRVTCRSYAIRYGGARHADLSCDRRCQSFGVPDRKPRHEPLRSRVHQCGALRTGSASV